MLWYSVCSFLFFCLEPTLRKDIWMRATSATVMIIFSKVPFGKLHNHNFVQRFFPTITRHFNKSILKDILQLKILQTWIKIRANFFIKTLVNIMNWKSRNVSLKLSLANKKWPCISKNIAPKQMILHLSLYASFSFNQT